MVMDLSDVQVENTWSSNFVQVEGRVTDLSEAHSLKAHDSRRVTPSGMSIDSSDTHW